MSQCGHEREAEQSSLWWSELAACVCVLVSTVCVCVWVTIRGQACVRMDIKVLVAVAYSCFNTAPCHPCRRKKNRNERSWKKSWRRITARSPRLRPSWYALLRQHTACCCCCCCCLPLLGSLFAFPVKYTTLSWIVCERCFDHTLKQLWMLNPWNPLVCLISRHTHGEV